MNYYELIIDKTARPMGNNTDWQNYDQERKEFKTLKLVKDYLAEQYSHVKTTSKMFAEDEKGHAIEVGKVYHFKSDPVSYDDVKHLEQHWVVVSKITPKVVLI